MARIAGVKTAYKGVRTLGGGNYHLRFQIKDPTTGKYLWRERIVEAANAKTANVKKDQLAAEEQQKLEAGRMSDRPRMKVFAQEWLDGRMEVLKLGTAKRYASTIEHHILPTFGEWYVDQIRARDIEKWRDGMDAAPSTINSRLRVFKVLMAKARVTLHLPHNEAEPVEPVREDQNSIGKDDEDEDTANSLSRTELDVFMTAAQQHQPKWFPVFAVLAYTGMRIGEAVALKWIDLVPPTQDGQIGWFRIRRNLSAGEIETPKTKRGKRRPDLPIELYRILCAHKEQLGAWTFRYDHRELRLADMTEAQIAEQQERVVNYGWIFPRGDQDAPMFQSTLRKPLLRVLAAIEAEQGADYKLAVHGIRRTVVNLLRQAGVDRIVLRSIVGHAGEPSTEWYSTVEQQERAAASQHIVNILSKKPEKRRIVLGGGVGDPRAAANG